MVARRRVTVRLPTLVTITLGFVLAWQATGAHADTVYIAFTGTVTGKLGFEEGFPGPISIGDPIAGLYSYDSDAPCVGGIPPVSTNYPQNPATHTMWMKLGELIFRVSPDAPFDNYSYGFTIENNNAAGRDVYGLGATVCLDVIPGVEVRNMGLQLTDKTGTAIDDLSLPLAAPDLAQWGPDTWLMLFGYNNNTDESYTILGELSSFALVPEPASAAVLALGLAGFCRRRRR